MTKNGAVFHFQKDFDGKHVEGKILLQEEFHFQSIMRDEKHKSDGVSGEMEVEGDEKNASQVQNLFKSEILTINQTSQQVNP